MEQGTCRVCVICSGPLSGRQTKLCSKPCRNEALYRSDSYQRIQATRERPVRTVYLVDCAACGEQVKKNRPSSPQRRVVCSVMCRYYVHYGRWQSQPVPQPRERIVVPKSSRVYYGDCVWCGKSHAHSRPGKRWCSAKCIKQAERKRRKAREHGASGTYTWTQVMALFRC